jgi:hypothetical protein
VHPWSFLKLFDAKISVESFMMNDSNCKDIILHLLAQGWLRSLHFILKIRDQEI